MITNDGKTVIRQFFGGQVKNIADFIAVGTGTTPVAVGHTALTTEAARAKVTSVRADLDNNRIVFKATLPPPPQSVFTITEVGILHSESVNVTKLVARLVLTTPRATDEHLPTEIEYSLRITV